MGYSLLTDWKQHMRSKGFFLSETSVRSARKILTIEETYFLDQRIQKTQEDWYAGFLSGALLLNYCPAVENCKETSARCHRGPSSPAAPTSPPPPVAPPLSSIDRGSSCHGQMLWFIVGSLTLLSPILVTLCQRWLRPPAKHIPSNPLVRAYHSCWRVALCHCWRPAKYVCSCIYT